MNEIQTRFPSLPIEGMEDLPRLFEEFSRTTTELVATHDALRDQVQSLERELADKDRRLERKKRLEALGRVAAGVAHEFRNPLGGVRLTVDTLIEGATDDGSRERLRHIRRAVRHLDRIVDDLLTFTRDEELERRSVAVAELVHQAIELAFAEGDPGVVVGGDEALEITVDRHAFTPVLVNLLVNAHQAAGGVADGRLGVWWGRRDGRHWIEIADDGPGVPAGEEERIFHPFHSLREGGTGLGLAIVHSRVEAHDGEITLADDPWGGRPEWRGARFRILLDPGDKED